MLCGEHTFSLKSSNEYINFNCFLSLLGLNCSFIECAVWLSQHDHMTNGVMIYISIFQMSLSPGLPHPSRVPVLALDPSVDLILSQCQLASLLHLQEKELKLRERKRLIQVLIALNDNNSSINRKTLQCLFCTRDSSEYYITINSLNLSMGHCTIPV